MRTAHSHTDSYRLYRCKFRADSLDVSSLLTKFISTTASWQEQIILGDTHVRILHRVWILWVYFHVITFHFLSLAAPAAAAKATSHFWASCLSVWDPLHLVTWSQRHAAHRHQRSSLCRSKAVPMWLMHVLYMYRSIHDLGMLLTWGTNRTSRSVVFFSLLLGIALERKKWPNTIS